MLAGRDPVPLGGGVNLENMGPGAEDRLLPDNTVIMRTHDHFQSARKVKISPQTERLLIMISKYFYIM